jgi:2-methylcitrate dehydratase PrpD
MTLSESVVDIITGMTYDVLPASVVQNVKNLVLDHLGVAAVGSTSCIPER